jgi:hypothetical protein
MQYTSCDLGHEIGGAVDDGGLLVEVGVGVDEADELDNALDLAQVPIARGLELRQDVEPWQKISKISALVNLL